MAHLPSQSSATDASQLGRACVLVALEQLIVGIERERLAGAVERAFRQIDVGLAKHRAHVLEVDAAIRQRLRIDLDADGRLLLAADAHEADSGYLRELLQQNVLRIGVDDGRQDPQPSSRHDFGGSGRVPETTKPSAAALDVRAALALWQRSAALAGMKE